MLFVMISGPAHAKVALRQPLRGVQVSCKDITCLFCQVCMGQDALTSVDKISTDAFQKGQARSHLFFAMMCEITQQLGCSFRAPLPRSVLSLSSALHSRFWHSACLHWL